MALDCSTLSLRSSVDFKRRKNPTCLADVDAAYAHLDHEEYHEAALPGVMESLAQLQAEFETSGQYKEAELAKVRLDRLKQQEDARQHEEFQSQQIAERLGVEEAHMQELKEFNEVWENKDAAFESHVATLHQTLLDRHAQGQTTYVEKISVETEPRQPKWSKELMDLRKMMERQAKQKNYMEAAKLQEDVKKLEDKEHAMWKALREAKIGGLEEKFVAKQQMEMTGLISRIEANRNEHKLSKEKELQRLLQRYLNVKTQMERQQKISYHNASKYEKMDWETASQISSRPSSFGGPRLGGPRKVGSSLARSSFGGSPLQPLEEESRRPSRPSTSSGCPPNVQVASLKDVASSVPRAKSRVSTGSKLVESAVGVMMNAPVKKPASSAPSSPNSAANGFAPPRRQAEQKRPSSSVGTRVTSTARPGAPVWK